MEFRWMVSTDELDALTPDALYELGCQVSDALNRMAYAAECKKAIAQDIEDTDMDTN